MIVRKQVCKAGTLGVNLLKVGDLHEKLKALVLSLIVTLFRVSIRVSDLSSAVEHRAEIADVTLLFEKLSRSPTPTVRA